MPDIVAPPGFPLFSAVLEIWTNLDLGLDTLFEFGPARLLDGLEALIAR